MSQLPEAVESEVELVIRLLLQAGFVFSGFRSSIFTHFPSVQRVTCDVSSPSMVLWSGYWPQLLAFEASDEGEGHLWGRSCRCQSGSGSCGSCRPPATRHRWLNLCLHSSIFSPHWHQLVTCCMLTLSFKVTSQIRQAVRIYNECVCVYNMYIYIYVYMYMRSSS